MTGSEKFALGTNSLDSEFLRRREPCLVSAALLLPLPAPFGSGSHAHLSTDPPSRFVCKTTPCSNRFFGTTAGGKGGVIVSELPRWKLGACSGLSYLAGVQRWTGGTLGSGTRKRGTRRKATRRPQSATAIGGALGGGWALATVSWCFYFERSCAVLLCLFSALHR